MGFKIYDMLFNNLYSVIEEILDIFRDCEHNLISSLRYLEIYSG